VSDDAVVAVFAHPDDESLLVGGTLAACAKAGLEVGVLSLTRGELGPGGDPASATPEDLGAARALELQAAADALGASWAECMAYPDGELGSLSADELAAALRRRLAERRPAAVITFAPEGLYWHPDHVAVHRITAEAVAAERSTWLYGATWPTGLAASVVAELASRGAPTDLWGLDPRAFGADPASITTTVDVSAFLPAKLRALRSHRSQLGPDHALTTLPAEVAERLLAREYFVRLHPREATRDWLSEVVERA
jgi:N-acetyl-1-D-myo-inositol-2-amino-2-deoxy-alpha-D-glucopyranoside deacetylase